MSFTAEPPTGAAATIRDILARAHAPVSFAALVKQSKFPKEVLREVLGAEEGRHRIFRWPDARRQQRFWSIGPFDYARSQILEVAATCAMTPTDLAEQTRKKCHGYPKKLVQSLVQQLIKEKALRKYPAFGRESSLIGCTGHPAAYAEAARRFKEKIDAKVRAEAGSADVGADLLEAMHRLEPMAGVPVSVKELRAALPLLGKPEFDGAALALWKGRKAFLSRHDYPQSLPQDDLDLLVDGHDGNYYVAITASSK
jgi:hypothetical protein